MSGTSMDGVDAALLEVSEKKIRLVSSHYSEYPENLIKRLKKSTEEKATFTIDELGKLNVEVGAHFADAANKLIELSKIEASEITAIGSHGQTIRHKPNGQFPFSLQLGNGPTIAVKTNIRTVCDFRSLDVARGGEGAPLIPPFQKWLMDLKLENNCIFLNIGGIANITIIKKTEKLVGFDTGPGNCLMDFWVKKKFNQAFDSHGLIAASGEINFDYLRVLLKHPHFHKSSPKSTGFEEFNLSYILTSLQKVTATLSDKDILATLSRLTAHTIASEIESNTSNSPTVYVFGGGLKNTHLMTELSDLLPLNKIVSTSSLGIKPDFFEAAAFAWLAYMRISEKRVELTTNIDRQKILLGTIHVPH